VIEKLAEGLVKKANQKNHKEKEKNHETENLLDWCVDAFIFVYFHGIGKSKAEIFLSCWGGRSSG
jgi:hypothetical protein